MGTISEKLIYLNDTKIALMTALENMGVDVPSNATFRELAELVYTIATTGDGTDLQSIIVNQNGTYIADPSYYGLNQVVVDVPDPFLIAFRATENGIFTPDEGVDGFDEIIVDVSSASDLESLTVTENGIYTPDDGFDGFSSVEVDVEIPRQTIFFNDALGVFSSHFMSPVQYLSVTEL